MTGRDLIDDASAVVASLRAEVAAQRALLERVLCSVETDAIGPEMRISGDTLRVRDAIRAHLAGAAVPAASERVFGVAGSPSHVAFWDAINEYASACGGDPSKHVYGNTRRQKAVASIENVVHDLVLVRKAGKQ